MTARGKASKDDGSLSAAVTTSLAAVAVPDQRDAAAQRLAGRYAAAIDAAEDRTDALDRLGPKLLACLAALHATPAARRGVVNPNVAGPDHLARLRAERARRSV